MGPEDLERLRLPADPRLHPDGRRIAFTVTRMDLEEDRYRSEIWLWDGERSRPFTGGPSDRAPRWSPDGRRLAFLRTGPGEDDRAQVAVMATDGGEGRVVTDLPLGVEELQWSPEGTRLVMVGVTWTAEWVGLDDEERARRPRRVREVPWRADDRGWVHDRRRHLYLVDPEGEGDLSSLTEGDFDETAPVWRPDGGAVAFLSARQERRGLEPGNQAYQVEVGSGEVRLLVDTGFWQLVSYRPDGVVHMVGHPDQWAYPVPMAVWRRREDGELDDLTGHLDRSVFPLTPALSPAGPRWVGEDFVIELEDRSRVRVVRVSPDGTVRDLIGGDRVVRGVDPGGDGVAFVAEDPTDPGELWWWDEEAERRLTSLNETFRREVPLVAPQPFGVPSGGEEIDAWVYLPPGKEAVPVLLNIHGGPAAQYGMGFFDEFQVYAGAGYGVVACNPRGSSGRGAAFLRSVVGEGWGTVDVEDVTAVLEEALARFPRLDSDRLGVMGGSYGGFLTAWLIARDHRFGSAVVERALLAWESFSGTSDIGPFFSRNYLETELPQGYETLHTASPVAMAHRIRTPTLVLHSEDDFRCPIEQAEQLFVALRKAGVEAEMVRFPGEGHELSRSGTPRHRRQRFEIILDWHARHLGEVGPNLAR